MKKIDWSKYLGWITTVITIITAVYLFGRQEKAHAEEVRVLITEIAVLKASDNEQEETISKLIESNEALTQNQVRLTTIVEFLAAPNSD